MVCCAGKSPAKLMEDLENRFGHYNFVESNLSFDPERKEEIYHTLMVEKKIPCFEGAKIVRVNYEDGCKVYFDDNSFVICRFSGTEPLLRIFAEASTAELASAYIAEFRTMLDLD